MMLFLHSSSCWVAYHHSQVLGFLSVCTCRGAWLQAWHGWRATRPAAQESPGALSSPSWAMSWAVSPKTWRLTLLVCRSVFPSASWVLITGQHRLLLFYISHFQNAVTFSWICGGPADLILLSSFISVIVSAWSYHTHTPQPENVCEGQTQSPLTGKAHVIWELSVKCTVSVTSSCSEAFVRYAILDLVVVSHIPIAQLFRSSETLR